MKKFFSILLAMILLVGTLPAYAANEAVGTYTGPFVAINTATNEDSVVIGSFTATISVPKSSAQKEDRESIVWENAEDPSAGKPMGTDRIIIEESRSVLKAGVSNASYTVGKTLRMYNAVDYEYVTMTCMAVGTHCTVWGNTSEGAVKLTSEVAAEIAEAFDSYQPLTQEAFGNAVDVDRDGKLAIFCYDISKDYVNKYWGSYTAGYFNPSDILNRSIDCIHLDTYPGMAMYAKELFTDVESCYSTLVHEYQHLINESNSNASNMSEMETYLNEAFSMAAEHMICGPETTESRISYFNDPMDYSPGWPLCYWDDELSNYSNSYLFGQYLRTRYKQLNVSDDNGNGDTLFKKVMRERDDDTLGYLADLFGTTKEQLIRDFWLAVYMKESSGDYGFAGESWADSIEPQVTTLTNGSFSCSDIYNGSARYFNVPKGATVTVTSSSNVVIVPLLDIEDYYKASVTNNRMTFDVHLSEAGTAVVAFYSEQGQLLDFRQMNMSGGKKTLEIAGKIQDPDSVRWKVFAYDGDLVPFLLQNAAVT